MKKTICDRCGKDVPDKLEYPVYGLAMLKSHDFWKRFDLCPDCQVDLASWFNKPCNKSGVGEENHDEPTP